MRRVLLNGLLFVAGVIGGFVALGTIGAWYFAGFSIERMLQ